jgi:hypothetical protein
MSNADSDRPQPTEHPQNRRFLTATQATITSDANC